MYLKFSFDEKYFKNFKFRAPVNSFMTYESSKVNVFDRPLLSKSFWL